MADLTLRQWDMKTKLAENMTSLEGQGNSAVNQLLSVKAGLFKLRDAATTEAEKAEIVAVITALAARIQKEVLGS
jgi:hypothetical protein